VSDAGAAERRQHLLDVMALLWPEPARAVLASRPSAADGIVADFLVLPDVRSPRLLVPTRSSRAAAAAVRRYNAHPTGAARLRARLLAAGLRAGIAPVVLGGRLQVHLEVTGGPADSLPRHLERVLGRDLLVSLAVGPPRANRKPVLQLLTHSGETVGFAKVGVNDLTRRLVRAERDALEALARAPLAGVTVPSVLHAGEWRGLDVLVQSPLPVWRRRSAGRVGRRTRGGFFGQQGEGTVSARASAMRAVAEAGGVEHRPLAGSPYLAQLRSRLSAIGDRVAASTLDQALDAVIVPGGRVAFGAWHGDWTDWNHAVLPGTVLVWDWERYAQGVPVGFDALHHHLQGAVRGTPARADAARFLDAAPALLAPLGVDSRCARTVAVLYLVDIAARWLADGQAAAGARFGQVHTWLLPELDDEVRRGPAAVATAVSTPTPATPATPQRG